MVADLPPGPLREPFSGRASGHQPLYRRLVQVALLAALLALFVRTFVVRTYQVASLSMSPALLPGDHLLIDRFSSRPRAASGTASWIPARHIARGDVLVFQLPRRPWLTAVKRCVGLPGEQVSWRGNRLRIDGQPLAGLSLPDSSEGELRLGPGEIFVLGDNHGSSKDSRAWGPLPIVNIRGRAILIYWSTAPLPGSAERDAWGTMPEHSIRRWARTRWDRIFVPVS